MRQRAAGERVWPGVLAGAFLFGLAASWQRWGNPLIDTGREMNQPLRLAAGEALYSDVRHIYGPLSPWLHAALFRLFDASLTILYADGIVTAALVLAIVYWLACQVMRPAAAGAATLSVMFLCVFKPAGNYLLPYSYNALHGTLLSLTTLALVVGALRRPAGGVALRFAAAGVAAGLAMLAKTEAGLAAMSAGVAGAALSSAGEARHRILHDTVFLATALGLTAAGYAVAARQAGWSTLLGDSWLLAYNVPPELRHYNAWISGLDDPLRSLRRVITAALKLGILAALIAAVSNIRVRRTDPASHPGWPPARVLGIAAGAAILLSITVGLDWDKGPYLAMPLLLGGLIVLLIREHRKASPADARPAILLTCSVFALVSLARMILHVRSGGAHASFLLPVSVVLFTYLWVGPFAARFANARAGRLAAAIALSLITFDAAATALIQAYKYRTRQTVPIQSARGTLVAAPDLGLAWNEALAFIRQRTRPGETVAVMPEGTSLTFLSGRRHPLREEITTPGFLDADGEARAIRRLAESATPLILVTNRPTAEFGARVFGRDYNVRLMRWIEARYATCAVLGPAGETDPEVGDEVFFIRAYCAR